jgi:molybdopterin-binding protein
MGRDVTAVPPERREIGFVYQRGYLFPHLSVEENVGYGAADGRLASELSERLGVTPLLKREVRGLSGGEQQLVAIARAIAARPKVLLLDEPFSALDPRRRSLVRRTVRALRDELGMTVLQVTHDFAEAGLLGDLAILLDGGRVLQSGPPEEVFRHPASPYIAEFLGAENVFAGEIRIPHGTNANTGDAGDAAIEFSTGGLTFHAVGSADSGAAHAVIRAGEVVLSREPPHSSARNNFEGVVSELATTGALAHVTVDVSGVPIVAALTTRSADELALAPGTRVWVSFKAMAVHLC